jgi:hypothetical protein
MNNDKYINVLIDNLVNQRNEALNQIAQLKSQLQVVTEEFEVFKKEQESKLDSE